MTPLERLMLTQIFSADRDGDGLYFHAEEGPVDIIVLRCAAIAEQGRTLSVLVHTHSLAVRARPFGSDFRTIAAQAARVAAITEGRSFG